MADRMVQCKKFNKELPGLEKPPFQDALGEEIFAHVSKEAWELWTKDMMIKVINEYRLNLAEAEQYETLIQQMKSFLNLKEGTAPMLEVENAQRGKNP